MPWHIYLRENTVYVPTVAKTDVGYYMDVDPVRTVSVSDSHALQAAIAEAMNKGNPIVPTPSRAAFPKPAVLRHVGLKSWATFEKDATLWTIREEDGGYRVVQGKRGADRGWEDDPDRIELLPFGATVETVARRVASLLQPFQQTEG